MSALDGLNLQVLGIAALIGLAVAVAGGLATDIGDWYLALRKPDWQPPGWVFGPVWTTIFTLCVLAFAIGWRDASVPGAKRAMVIAFGLNAVLNVAWSVLFFKIRRPDWAFLEVIALWLSIAAMIAVMLPISRLAALLIAPYLVWVTIAAVLNLTIIRLNGPFGPQS